VLVLIGKVQAKNLCLKGILHFFLEIGSFDHSPRVKQLSFTVFECIEPFFKIFIIISVTRQFLVSLISIVEVNGTRNCLVTDILLNIRKSAE